MVKSTVISSDHAGFALKEEIKSYLVAKGIEVEDMGTFSEERADYPDFAHKVSEVIQLEKHKLGILICGSGNGINMAANKHEKVRSALCWKEEIASLARQHNDANIIALPARFIELDEAKRCVDTFFDTEFEGGRHEDRVNKIALAC